MKFMRKTYENNLIQYYSSYKNALKNLLPWRISVSDNYRCIISYGKLNYSVSAVDWGGIIHIEINYS